MRALAQEAAQQVAYLLLAARFAVQLARELLMREQVSAKAENHTCEHLRGLGFSRKGL